MLAIPEEFVTATPPLGSNALAPLDGSVKFTATLFKGWPALSVTFACNGVAKAELTGALCGVPPVALTDEAGPTTESENVVDGEPHTVDDEIVTVKSPTGPALVMVTA